MPNSIKSARPLDPNHESPDEDEVDKTENTIKSNKAKLVDYETKLADLEDRNRRDNVRILGISKGAEGPTASQFISANFLKWFPNLGEQRMEIMRAHHVGPRTLICKMLRYTQILHVLRKTPVKLQDREIRFSTDGNAAEGFLPRRGGSEVSKPSYSTRPD
ncbi:hypothetical protein D5F01_LYC06257 [Larimichthys crocea]|uniref:Uncharacterized protein n=1 Tax=Larimichthys crocea TaxID=215358 RepID=A0A6G0IVM8_LARCR|nr:hypothetical protein D5F01_LYC06257 [Larimichthys crocea]